MTTNLIWKRVPAAAREFAHADHWTGSARNVGIVCHVIQPYGDSYCVDGCTVDIPEFGFDVFTSYEDGQPAARLGWRASLSEAQTAAEDYERVQAEARKRATTLRRLRRMAWNAYRYGAGRKPTLASI